MHRTCCHLQVSLVLAASEAMNLPSAALGQIFLVIQSVCVLYVTQNKGTPPSG